MTLHQSAVPAYDLYGDGNALPLEEFFHCETIKVRSQLHEWEIAPHLHPSLSQVLFIARGQVDLRLGEIVQSLAGPQLVIVPTPIVHGFRFSPDVVGYVVTVSQSFLTSLPRQDVLRVRMERPLVHAPESNAARRLLLLGRELHRAEQMGFDANGHMLHRALGDAWLRLAITQFSSEAGEERVLVRRFQALVETSYRTHQPLSYYAAQLNCTVRTLARQVNEALGMTPMQLINRRLLVEARRLLRFTNARCADVAAELGFEDPSYFSRFYLREAGVRPNSEKTGTHVAQRE
jgi:AraC family transcriptional regulator, transcriptional activator of pobA